MRYRIEVNRIVEYAITELADKLYIPKGEVIRRLLLLSDSNFIHGELEHACLGAPSRKYTEPKGADHAE